MRRLLLLSFVFVASSCGSNSGFSCHHGSDGISVSVGSNLDASGVHHSVVDNSTDSPSDQSSTSGDNQSSPGSTDTPDSQSSTVSLIDPSSDDSPDQSSTPGDNQSSTTSLDLPDPEVASGESSDFPATYFVIWNGKSYEPSDCITVMWGRLCLSAK